MIKIKEIEITGNSKTIKYYKSIGYDIKSGIKIFVKMEDLIKTSSIKVECYCDICNSINSVKYYNYIGNIERNGIYRCNDCSKSIRANKMKELHLDKDRSRELTNKTKSTNISKYGVDNPNKLESFRDKRMKSMIERYGVDTAIKNIDLRNKMFQTNIKKYGTNYYFESDEFKDKYKKIIFDKYGVDNVFKNEDIKDKIKNTLMIRYGVDNPTKNIDIFNKAQKNSYKIFKYGNTEITYQGTYELDFLNFCVSNKLDIKNGPTIDYFLDNKNRKYHSDFYIPQFNLICEVKSCWTFDSNIIENYIKMEYSIKSGYNFLFIIDKNYDELKSFLKL